MFGVPQGSVLGTLLLNLLYINDINNCLNDKDNVKLALYADDTNIFVLGENRESTINKANGVLQNINSFYEKQPPTYKS